MRFPYLVTQFLRPGAGKARPVTPDAAPATKASRSAPMIAMHQTGQPVWTPRRTAALAEEGFRKNTVAYRCVMQIATTAAAIPWLLYDPDGHEIDRHPLLDLLAHPNPLQDGTAFMETVHANLQIAGNAYIEAIRPDPNGPPTELYALRPDRMSVVPGASGLPQGYQYSVNGHVTSWPCDALDGRCDILHLKTFHPLDDWYGLAPMEAALLSIDQHNAAGAWNQALLGQGARPSGALIYAPKDGSPATLSDEQLHRLREEIGQLNGGSRNAGRPLILEGGLDWREMSLSPKDMDWLAGRDRAARDIALAFGVPSQLVGLPDAQTYANIEQARTAFYEETVLPQVTRVIAGFDHWLGPMYRAPNGGRPELDYDPDAIGALTAKRQAQWDKLQNATFLTRNEKRAAAGYGPVPGGDEDDNGGGNDDEDGGAKLRAYSKYSDDQPRVPAGSSDGGQWTNGLQSFIDDFIQPAIDAIAGLLMSIGPYGMLAETAIATVGEIGPFLGAAVGGVEDAGAFIADDVSTLLGSINENLGDVVDAAEQAAQSLIDTLTPKGEALGEEGTETDIRVLSGGANAADGMFRDLTQNGTLSTPATYPEGATQYTLPDGSRVGYRPTSKSGPPTIDVNTEALKITITKLKFKGD